MADHEIFLLANECATAFQKALTAISGPDSLMYRPLLEYHQRFELWAGFLGVFADEPASLDRRLKLSPELRKAITQLLGLMCTNLQRGKTTHS